MGARGGGVAARPGHRRRVVIASNRGPIQFVRTEEGVEPRRGSGGLVTALTGVLEPSGGLWLASAMTDEDRRQAEQGRVAAPGDTGYDLRYLSFPPDVYDLYYNQISNRMLWFLHHCLWDLPRAPSWDRSTRQGWAAYGEVNRAFAAALAEEASDGDDPYFLVQDYHLSLTPAMLRERCPHARIAHFSHIPFAGPLYLRVLPVEVRRQLLEGLLGADVLGFHASAWAENFLLCCRTLPGAKVSLAGRRVRWQGREVRVGVYPISIDANALEREATTEAVTRARRRVSRWIGDAKLVLRVDRAEISKNILRGFHAFETFLERNPRWHGDVKFLGLFNPSRGDLPEYQRYLRNCLREGRRINQRFGTDHWQPIKVWVQDHYPSVVAAFERYDVLMVNSMFDGMNLVAKEGPVLNRRNGVLILSQNTGAFDELGDHALAVNPFDVEATAEAIAEGLAMEETERVRRLVALQRAVRDNTLTGWVEAQLRALERARVR